MTSYYDRRLASRLEDPEYRTEFERATATMRSDRDGAATKHAYPRPPRPGDRAYCGHRWTPDEAAAIWRGDPMSECVACGEARR